MVRECRPPEREPSSSWLARRSTMATSTPASASSPASITPVGPPPATTPPCPVIATLRPESAARRHRPAAPRTACPAACTPAPRRRVPTTAPRVPPPVRRPRAPYAPATTHAFRYPHFRRFRPRPAIMRHDPGLAASPPLRYRLKVESSRYSPTLGRSSSRDACRGPPGGGPGSVDGQIPNPRSLHLPRSPSAHLTLRQTACMQLPARARSGGPLLYRIRPWR